MERLKSLKKWICVVLALSMVTTTAFAGTSNVRSLVRDYQINVRIQNMDPQAAIDQLTKDLLANEVSREDLIEFVRESADPVEFEQFISMLEMGMSEMSYIDQQRELSREEYEYILAKVLEKSQANMGANYNGGGQDNCAVTRTFGVIAIITAVVLAVWVIKKHHNRNGHDDPGRLDVGHSNGNGNGHVSHGNGYGYGHGGSHGNGHSGHGSYALGIGAGVSGVLGIILLSSCR